MAKSIKSELKAVSKKLLSLQQTVEKITAALEAKKASEAQKRKKTTDAKAKKPAAKSKKAAAPKSKKPAAKKETTAAATVLGFIRRSKKGIDTKSLMSKTGFDQKKIANIIYKLKKQGAIDSPEKGVYKKA